MTEAYLKFGRVKGVLISKKIVTEKQGMQGYSLMWNY